MLKFSDLKVGMEIHYQLNRQTSLYKYKVLGVGDNWFVVEQSYLNCKSRPELFTSLSKEWFIPKPKRKVYWAMTNPNCGYLYQFVTKAAQNNFCKRHASRLFAKGELEVEE